MAHFGKNESRTNHAPEARRILFEMGVGDAVGTFERDKDNEFVESMLERFEQYQERTLVSDAQIEYLRDIKDRL